MPAFAREHAGPLFGAAVLHVLLLGLLVVAALNWRAPQESVPLAIEGTVVRYQDLPPSLKSGRRSVEPAPAPPEPKPQPKPAPDPKAEAARAEQAAREAEAREARAAQERRDRAEQARARDAAAAEKRKADTAARERAAADARRRTAEADARKLADAEAARDKAAKEKAAQEAKSKAAREAELRRALAAEEEGEAVAQSGVVDEYRALLVQTIERNWIRPPSARAGLECTLNVAQAPGGAVVDVSIGACNGDQAVRESIANAVYRSSPLPAPRDPRAFQRRLVIVFKPTE